MKWWIAYKQLVENNTLGSAKDEIRALSYWRDKLFTNIILYLFPISFLALIPGVVMSFIGQIPLLAVFDLMAVLCFAFISFHPTINLSARKIILIICLYLLAIILLIYLGSFGPGLLYLLALTIFIALIFPIYFTLWSVAGNLMICILFSFLIHFRLLDASIVEHYTLGSWIAVSSNLVILSMVTAASIHLLFNGLQATIIKENTLQIQLKQESQSLERMLQKMETKNAELEQFAYIASHDLQEPLTTILSVVNLFDKQYKEKLDVNALTYLGFLSQSSSRMQALITGLLDYSRIGKETEIEIVDCNQILYQVLSELDEQIKKNKATIVVEPLPTFYAYRVELKQMFENLLTNALKFRKQEETPQVTVKAREEKDEYVFSVKDNGIGIEKKFTQKIFIIFQQLHAKSKYAGIGIGLAQCKKIAELHGGKIWVESTPSQGSTFYFTVSKDNNSYGHTIKANIAH
jgi:signal transduction histidine kinase